MLIAHWSIGNKEFEEIAMNYEIKSAQGALMLNKNINETTVDMLDSDYKMWLAKRATRQPDPNLCDSDDKFYNRFATRRIENDINVLWPRRGVARKARHARDSFFHWCR
jgi:hypothetical protein